MAKKKKHNLTVSRGIMRPSEGKKKGLDANREEGKATIRMEM